MNYRYEHPEYFENQEPVNYKDYDNNLVIFGAGVNGAIAARLLEKRRVRFLCFADSDRRKWGTEYLGYSVVSPDRMKEKYPDTAVMVTPYQIKAVHEQVYRMGYRNIITPHFLFLDFDIDSALMNMLPHYYNRNQLIYAMDRYLSKLGEFYANEFLPARGRALNLMITERCTLRCRECMNRIPYYTNPINYDWPKMKKALERLSIITTFQRVDVLGGEAFLHPQLSDILDFLIELPQFESITVITNGTKMPDERVLEAFRHSKVQVRISDYGENSYKINELEALFNRERIKHFIVTPKWFKCTEIYLQDRTAEEVQDVYANCCKSDSDLPHLADGRLYKCQFADSAERLGVIPKVSADSVNILEEPFNANDLLTKIDMLYLRRDFIDACRYCTGRGFYSETIPAAEQIEESIPRLQKM